MLLQTAIERYLEFLEFEQRGSEATITLRFYVLRQFQRYLESEHGITDLEEIKINHLRSYLAHLRINARYQPISLEGVIYSLRALYNFAVLKGITTVNLARRLKKPHVEKKEIVHFSWEEVETIFLSVPQGAAYLRDLSILLLFYYCGLRLNELRNLKLSDFSENFTEIYVEMGKGDKARLLPVHPFVQRMMPLYFQEREKSGISSPFLFPGRGNGPLCKSRIHGIVKHCGEVAGIKKRVSPHTFRHTFATHLHQKGVDINRLAELLGHTNIEKTAVYTHTEDSELTAAVLKLKEGRVVWRIAD